jgi:glycosyltransferase involved in cell wall biosynthesis
MPDAHPHRAPVPPVPDGGARPLWSVMIPTYHCARYLTETLRNVLAQAPGPELMQIEVVDDHSTADDPEAVVRAVGGGRVGFWAQPTNVGHTRNFQSCLTRARGRLVHLLHGDDYVRDGFYRRMADAFAARPDVGAAFCRPVFLDARGREEPAPLEQPEAGVLANGLARLASEQRIMTPAIVVRRDVYETLGGFDDRLVCSEDWEMWVRIAARHPVWYDPEPLAVYRMHDDSNTGRHVRTADDMRYTRMAIDIFSDYLPPDIAAEVTARARETYALSALGTAAAMLRRGDLAATLAQAGEALRLRPSPRVLRRLLQVVVDGGAEWLAHRGGRRTTEA